MKKVLNVQKERTKIELDELLLAILEHYESLISSGMMRVRAKEHVVRSYDDLDQYLYFKGEFK